MEHRASMLLSNVSENNAGMKANGMYMAAVRRTNITNKSWSRIPNRYQAYQRIDIWLVWSLSDCIGSQAEGCYAQTTFGTEKKFWTFFILQFEISYNIHVHRTTFIQHTRIMLGAEIWTLSTAAFFLNTFPAQFAIAFVFGGSAYQTLCVELDSSWCQRIKYKWNTKYIDIGYAAPMFSAIYYVEENRIAFQTRWAVHRQKFDRKIMWKYINHC